jgi:hypothetical protein
MIKIIIIAYFNQETVKLITAHINSIKCHQTNVLWRILETLNTSFSKMKVPKLYLNLIMVQKLQIYKEIFKKTKYIIKIKLKL